MADLPTRLHLTVVARERKVIDVEVDEVVLPASDGEIGVLPGHTPLLTTLRIGAMRYRVGNVYHRIVLKWGFAEVLPDRVIVLAETARLPQEINAATAEADRAAAERELLDLSSNDPEFALVEARLEESIAMINVGREH
ncbi:MAG TPA: ATP synthase F1 subunit epsilon [Thermoanaerobaculia bacterium]|jgi:F-type H+-transporting ATPase subunit epsilon